MASDPIATSPTPYKNRRGWLIAFGVIEILIACVCLLLVALVVFAVLFQSNQRVPEQPPMSAAVMIAFSVIFYGGIAALFFTAGIGSIKCKNWARITMLAVSGMWLGIGLLSMLVFLFLVPSIMEKQGTLPPETRRSIFLIMDTIMAFLMVVMPTIFLVFYSRKNVKATCLAGGKGPMPERLATTVTGSSPPVSVLILAIWEALGVSAVLAFFVIRATFLFGMVVHGLAAFLVLLSFSTLSGFAAVLIYRREFVGWGIAVFKVLFGLANMVANFAGHDILQLYREMGLSEQQVQIYQQFPQLQSWIWVMIMPVMIAYLALLFYTRKYFSRSGTPASPGTLNP
jgi:hypothetical protein